MSMLRWKQKLLPMGNPQGGGKGGGGGGSQQPVTQQVNNTSIPTYAQPYVETMLGAAQQQIFNYDDQGNVTGMKPYTPYSNNPSDYIAGFSPLQQQAQSNVDNMQVPGQYNTAMNYAQTAGLGALGTANPAAQYGGMGANAGLVGMGQGLSYGQNATDPNAVAAYMNPYLQATLNPAMQLQNQQFGQINAQNQGQATQQGAFGGGRQAVMQGLNQQNQMLAQNQLVGNAYNQAYNTANQNMQAASQLGMQGAGMGISGAQAGLQGINAQQAAYGQLGNQAANLGNLAGQQTQTALGINQAQEAAGAAQQAQQQNIINQGVQNYATQQQYPMTQLANMSALLRGLPMQQTTTQTYQAAPSAVSTLGGLGATALGAYGAAGGFKSAATGGLMKSYAGGGQVAFDVGGSVESDLNNMDDAHLAQEAKTSPSTMIRQEAAKILAERQLEKQAMAGGVGAAPAAQSMQMAGGGIVAFADGGEAEDFNALPKANINPGQWKGPIDTLSEWFNPKRIDPKTGLALTQSEYEQGPTPPPETKAKAEAPAAKTEAAPKAGGLGTTAAAQARTPAAPAAKEDITTDISKVYKSLQDLQGVPEERKAIAEQLKADRTDAKAQREQDMWLALMKGGAKAMASKSPFASVGLGEGAEAGAEGIAYANKAYNQALKEAQTGELDLAKLSNADRTNLLHYAVTGAVSDSNTRQKMAELKEIAATRAQGAGQAANARLDAAVTARAKLILGNNPMPTEQDVQNAIDIATRQVMGKGAVSSNPFSPDAIAAELARRNKKS